MVAHAALRHTYRFMAKQMTETDAEAGRVTMYHDGACPLCSMEVDHYRKIDREGRIRFVDAADGGAGLSEAGLTQDRALKRLHVRLSDGRLVSGARAFVEIWRVLPGWRRLAPIAAHPPIIWILEAAYRVFLPVRPVMARLARRFRRSQQPEAR